MGCVDDEIAWLEIGDIGGKSGQLDLEGWRAIKSEVSKRSSEPMKASCESGSTSAAPDVAFD